MIYFVVFCAFLSILMLLKLNKLEEENRHLEMELAVKCDSLISKLDVLKQKLLHVRDDYTDQIHDIKHDIYNKIDIKINNCKIDLFNKIENCIESTNDNIDVKIERLSILFQQERVELEQMKKSRSTDTFKSLRAALNPQAQDQTEKKDN